ncbi:hypothetical protein PCURB6_14720 [Paenibacillus curdlanolyticus]|nr:hypothetical protein PCURB6_14720 [Paenibacillus curdlanolyticus]
MFVPIGVTPEPLATSGGIAVTPGIAGSPGIAGNPVTVGIIIGIPPIGIEAFIVVVVGADTLAPATGNGLAALKPYE